MPQVTGSASEASAFFHVGQATAAFIDGDFSSTVNYSTAGAISPDEARLRAADLEVAADIATMLDGALQDVPGIVDAFLQVCSLNGWAASRIRADGRNVAARIVEGTEL